MACKKLSALICFFLKNGFTIIAIVAAHQSKGQSIAFSKERLQIEIDRTESLLSSFKNDSALRVIGPLRALLTKNSLLNSPTGLHIRLLEAIALQQKESGDSAIANLLPLLEQSRSMKQWAIYTRSCLTLALIYEKVNSPTQSRHYLQLTQDAIRQYRLDELYPYFVVRMASWERIFGSPEKSIQYAREVLRTAPPLRLKLEEAIGHMLMSFLLPSGHPDIIEHCRKAIVLYNSLEDHTGSSAMYHQLSRGYYQSGLFDLALASNDSAISAGLRSVSAGHHKHEIINQFYSQRGVIFKALGLYDSAFFNLEKGKSMAIDLMRKNIDDKIAEVSSRYEGEKKQEEIERQRMELIKQNQLLVAGMVTLVMLILLLYILYRNYRKLALQKKLIEEQSEQLKTLDAAKTRMFANISHELRTPLTLIAGPLNKVIKESSASEEHLKLLRMATSGCADLSSLINQILDLGKIDAGKMTICKEATHLSSFLQVQLANLEPLFLQKKIEYQFKIEVPADLSALIDREKYLRILNNLISNALKFTSSGGKVFVSAGITRDRLSLEVQDSGPGVHPDDLPNLFDRYFQITRTDRAPATGTGLGLAICQEYTRILGGEIAVSSTLGKGTTFTVNFPLEIPQSDDLSTADSFPNEAEASPGISEVKPNRSKDKPAILLVEDNLGLQVFIDQILRDHYHVSIAQNGKEALEELNSQKFDLIVSDLMMPVMDGYELLNRVKADDRTRGIPFIMLSARAEMQDKLRALRTGVDDYLTKPFDEEELKARVENLLNNLAVRKATSFQISTENRPLPDIASADQIWLKKFEDFIHRHYKYDKFSIPDIADEFAVSESTLLRQLKLLTGLSPVQYIQEVRLGQARILLDQNPYISVSQLASEVGYKDLRNFSRSFKKRFGKAPSEYSSLSILDNQEKRTAYSRKNAGPPLEEPARAPCGTDFEPLY